MKLYCSATTFDNNNISTVFETTIINVNVGDTESETIYSIMESLGYEKATINKRTVHFLDGIFIACVYAGDYMEIKAKLYPFSPND